MGRYGFLSRSQPGPGAQPPGSIRSPTWNSTHSGIPRLSLHINLGFALLYREILKLVQEEAVCHYTRMCFGTRTRSSIKSTSALSMTATGMASVSFKGLKRSLTTSRDWGSARYGSCQDRKSVV